MELTFGQVEALLRELHKVTDKRRATLRSRLQHLQKEDLPTGVAGVGRGTRFRYGLDETFMIVVALELARARVPTTHAAKLVKANWQAFRALVDEGLATAAARAADETHRATTRWAVIAADGLSLLRRAEPGEDTVVETVDDVPGPLLASWAQRATNPAGSAMIVLDIVSRVADAADILTRMTGFDPAARAAR